MKNNPRLFLWIIIALTVTAGILDLPATRPWSFTTPKLPGFNKTLTIVSPLYGSTINLHVGNFQFAKTYPFKEGLDLAGGTSVTLKADMSHIPDSQRDSALQGAQTVIEQRVNLFGVSEPSIQTSKVNNDYRLIVDLPGVNTDQAISLIGTTAQLSFWQQGASGSGKLRDPQTLPIGMLQALGPDAEQTNLTGSDIQNTQVTFDTNTGAPQVQLTFTSKGAQKFATITGNNVGKRVAIALDNVVVEAPTVQQAIVGGTAVITGAFTQTQANNLQIQLQAGQLPVPLSVLQQQSVGATLGQSSLQKSLFAGLLGILIIILFMSILYGGLGVIASIALVIYTILVLAIFKIIPVTLTLAGIAGFILSIGMAVDANILIFERTKEELRSGKAWSQALELGFSRAWSSIRDSNISTLITSFILYKFGTGTVRGFAFTLAIGVVVSMFSAIVITRTLLRVVFRRG